MNRYNDPNEPSKSDHNAPYNEIEITDEDGNEITVCGCHSCNQARRKKLKDEEYQ